MKFKSGILIKIFVIIFFNSQSLLAENKIKQKDTTNMNQLEEIYVRSFKQDKDYRFSPIAVSPMGERYITRREIVSVKELSSHIPNFYAPEYGSKLTSPVYIRGVGSRINSPAVALYVDGIPYFDKSVYDFEFNDIAKVDILRGPQGSLYGRNAQGGIINVFTKSPFKTDGTHINLGAGNYNDFKAAVSHYGSTGDKFGYSIAGNFKSFGGYFYNETIGKNVDDLMSGSGRVKLMFKPTDKLNINVVGSYEYSDQGGYPYSVYNKDTDVISPIDYNDESSYLRQIGTAGMTVERIGDKMQFSSQTSYQYFDDIQRIDQDFSVADEVFATQYQKQNQIAEEFNIKSVGDTRYKWLFGAFGFAQFLDKDVTTHNKPINIALNQINRFNTYGTAIYHQSTVEDLFTKNLSLVIGLRYDMEWAELDFQQGIKDKPETFKGFINNVRFEQFTPKLSLQYEIKNTHLIYITTSKGFKAGGFNTSFAADGSNKSFLPEISWNYEFGAKVDVLDGRLSSELALFYIDILDQQISQALPTGGYNLVNAGKSVSKGIEFSVASRPIRSLILQFNYGFTDAKFKEYVNKDADYSGNYVPNVPKHTFSLSADYSFDINAKILDEIILSTHYNGLSDIYWTEKNDIKQGFYGLLNAKISFVKGFLALDIWAKNITNTNYVAYYFEIDQKGFEANLAQRGRPFTIGVNLNFKF